MLLRSLSVMVYCFALCLSDPNDECGLISGSDVSSASESSDSSSLFIQTEGCTRDEICNKEIKPYTCVCKEGFTKDGENCKPMITCKRPAPPRRFGNWSTVDAPREDGSYYPGDRILYKCDSGYSLKTINDRKFRTCGANGLWYPTKVPVCVVAKCDAPNGTIANGNSTVKPGKKYSTGSIVEYSCFPGYRIKGSSWQSCLSRDSLTGEWSNPPPICEKVKCHDIGYPENSNRIGNPPYFIGAEVRFRCMSGYTLIGSESRRCQENGKWSGFITICERGDGDCKNPGIPMNGRKQGKDYNRRDTVLYYCDSGFSLIGSRNRTCLATGEWSGTQPTCRGHRDYDDPARVANSFGKILDTFVEDTEASENNGDSRGRAINLNYGGRLEMYIAIDGSASVGRTNFLRAVKFAKTLVEKTGVSGRPKGPRYGALSYTDVICDKFDVTIHDTKQLVLDELDRFKYPTEVGGTSTTAALDKIYEMISIADTRWEIEDNIHRVQPPKRVLILMTDGASNTGGSPIDAAIRLKRDYELEIYVIGINVEKKNDELYGIASTELPDEHIFILRNYHALDWLAEELVGQQIDYSICGVAGHTEPTSNTRGRISGGGLDAIEGAWPWQVALFNRIENDRDPRGYSQGGFFCGGSIISSDWILTAAHCFYNNKKIWEIDQGLWHTKVIVGLGYTNLDDDKLLHTKIMPITKVIAHPKYSRINLDYDIALMQLGASIDFGNYIRPVCLPNKTRVSDIPIPNDKMVATGWGETKNRSIGERPNSSNYALRQAYLPVVKWKKCEKDIEQTQLDNGKPLARLTRNMFCVGNGYPSSCVGDSGGAVVKKIPASNERDQHWVQFGIVSWGYGCGVVGQHDVMTNVTQFTDWIEDKTGIEL